MNRIEKLSDLLSTLGIDNMINEIRELKADNKELKNIIRWYEGRWSQYDADENPHKVT